MIAILNNNGHYTKFIYMFNCLSNNFNKLENYPPLIVGLTTIPERMHKVHLCIESILRQSLNIISCMMLFKVVSGNFLIPLQLSWGGSTIGILFRLNVIL